MTAHHAKIYDLSETSDQELVNLYLELVGAFGADSGPSDTHRIGQAASAAHALEIRGYVEQSGTWTHSDRPHLRAIA